MSNLVGQPQEFGARDFPSDEGVSREVPRYAWDYGRYRWTIGALL
jgi:hypothetical protein